MQLVYVYHSHAIFLLLFIQLLPEWKCTAVYHGVSRGNRVNYRENCAHSTWFYTSNRALTARNRPATARNLGGVPVLPLSRRK